MSDNKKILPFVTPKRIRPLPPAPVEKPTSGLTLTIKKSWEPSTKPDTDSP